MKGFLAKMDGRWKSLGQKLQQQKYPSRPITQVPRKNERNPTKKKSQRVTAADTVSTFAFFISEIRQSLLDDKKASLILSDISTTSNNI
jgi:hypothetical protein